MVKIVILLAAMSLVSCAQAQDCITFAYQDEWITHPDGRRVAQLVGDLNRCMPVRAAIAHNYQPGERVPAANEPMDPYDWMRRGPLGGFQIHLENRGWQPTRTERTELRPGQILTW